MSGSDRDDKKPAAVGAGTKSDATTFARLPQFDAASLMPQTEGKLLTALKEQIGQLTIEQAASGIRHQDGRYDVLPRTLRSAWMAKVRHPVLGEMKFLIGQTRSTWVLLYDKPHEKVYEDPRFMSVELKRRDVALTPRGKRMYVSRIERADLDRLNAIAAQDAGERTGPQTLAPVEGSFSIEATLARLAQCTVEQCTDDYFELAAFVASIHFMTPTQGGAGNYYYLDAGSEDAPMTCELHVGKDPRLEWGTWRHKAMLSHGQELSFLYMDLRY